MEEKEKSKFLEKSLLKMGKKCQALESQNNDLLTEIALLRSKLLMLQAESKYHQVPTLTITRESAASKNDEDWKDYCIVRGVSPRLRLKFGWEKYDHQARSDQ